MSNTRKRYVSLEKILVLVVAASIAIPAALTGFFLIKENFDRTVEHDSNVAATNYVELLQAGMTMPLWNIAADLGEPLINSVSIDPSVLSINVRTLNDEHFISHENPNADSEAETIKLSRNIIYEGEMLGKVHLTYSLTNARLRAENESRLLLTILIFQLIFSIVLVGVFLRKRVISPLRKLESAAMNIADGDLKSSIPTLKDDEFGALSEQLEKMRGSLESSFSTLEVRVQERTTDLSDVNDELNSTVEQLKKAQGNLVQSEKLAALGALVAGVAHELNTPIGNGLTVASSLYDSTRSITALMEGGMTKSALEEYLSDMDEGSRLVVGSLERASELVSSFKQVAMDRTSAQRRIFDLRNMLIETRLTVSPAFKHTPYIIYIECKEGLFLDGYPGPLGQIVTNLLNNTLIHAFDGSDKGHVSVLASMTDEEHCCLSIGDDGVGIPEENISRIFDPFFTTKLGEGGNGLGMHIVHNLVTGILGGTIEVESEVGIGTRFTIILPIEAPLQKNDDEPDYIQQDDEGGEAV
ncbi:MAG: two-component system NtrC family sensor kinase [Flavobacteriales bacterium]